MAADPSTEVPGADPNSGAHVISCSLGPNGANWIMRSVLDDAIRFVTEEARDGAGVPLLWAATNGDYEIRHDEVCSHPNVMAVSRMRRNEVHDNAGYGEGLEFLAPGVDVYSTTQGGYAYGTGCMLRGAGCGRRRRLGACPGRQLECPACPRSASRHVPAGGGGDL